VVFATCKPSKGQALVRAKAVSRFACLACHSTPNSSIGKDARMTLNRNRTRNLFGLRCVAVLPSQSFGRALEFGHFFKENPNGISSQSPGLRRSRYPGRG